MKPASAKKSRKKHSVKKLFLIAAACLFINFFIYWLTHNLIAKNKQQHGALLSQLTSVLPEEHFDNDIISTKQTEEHRTIYQACKDGKPRFAIIELLTDKGYGGDIKLLVSVDLTTQSIVHVRTLFHQESLGLGDQIEANKTVWVRQFYLPLQTLTSHIAIRQDGGEIDAIPAATLSSRAVSNVLRQQIFALGLDNMGNRC